MRRYLYINIFSISSIILSIYSQLYLIKIFKLSNDLDTFFLATALSTYIQIIFSQTFKNAFLPIMIEVIQKNSKSEGASFSFQLLIIYLLFFIVIAIFISGFSSVIKSLFQSTKYHTLGSSFVMVYLLANLNLVLSPLIFISQASLHAINKFGIDTAAKMIQPLILIIGCWTIIPLIGITGIVIFNIIGVLCESAILLIATFKYESMRVSFKFSKFSNLHIKFFKVLLPLLIGNTFSRIMSLSDRYFASFYPDGSVALLEYSKKVIGFLTQLVATINLLGFTKLSFLYNQGRDFIKRFILDLKIIIIIFIWLFTLTLSFGKSVSILLSMYYTGIKQNLFVFYNLIVLVFPIVLFAPFTGLLNQYFYIKQKTKITLLVNLIIGVATIIINFILLNFKTIYTIPIAYNLSYFFSIIFLIWNLNKLEREKTFNYKFFKDIIPHIFLTIFLITFYWFLITKFFTLSIAFFIQAILTVAMLIFVYKKAFFPFNFYRISKINLIDRKTL